MSHDHVVEPHSRGLARQCLCKQKEGISGGIHEEWVSITPFPGAQLPAPPSHLLHFQSYLRPGHWIPCWSAGVGETGGITTRASPLLRTVLVDL